MRWEHTPCLCSLKYKIGFLRILEHVGFGFPERTCIQYDLVRFSWSRRAWTCEFVVPFHFWHLLLIGWRIYSTFRIQVNDTQIWNSHACERSLLFHNIIDDASWFPELNHCEFVTLKYWCYAFVPFSHYNSQTYVARAQLHGNKIQKLTIILFGL